jgi:hypothetical protein
MTGRRSDGVERLSCGLWRRRLRRKESREDKDRICEEVCGILGQKLRLVFVYREVGKIEKWPKKIESPLEVGL